MTTAKEISLEKSEDSLHDISEAFFNLVLQRIAPKKHTGKVTLL